MVLHENRDKIHLKNYFYRLFCCFFFSFGIFNFCPLLGSAFFPRIFVLNFFHRLTPVRVAGKTFLQINAFIVVANEWFLQFWFFFLNNVDFGNCSTITSMEEYFTPYRIFFRLFGAEGSARGDNIGAPFWVDPFSYSAH